MGTSLRAYTRLRMRTSIGCPRFAFAAAEAIIAAPGIALPSSNATGSSRALGGAADGSWISCISSYPAEASLAIRDATEGGGGGGLCGATLRDLVNGPSCMGVLVVCVVRSFAARYDACRANDRLVTSRDFDWRWPSSWRSRAFDWSLSLSRTSARAAWPRRRRTCVRSVFSSSKSAAGAFARSVYCGCGGGIGKRGCGGGFCFGGGGGGGGGASSSTSSTTTMDVCPTVATTGSGGGGGDGEG